MPFLSFDFILIIIVTFLVYWSVRNVSAKNWILAIGCYAFYATVGAKFVLLLFGMTTLTYFAGNYIISKRKNSRIVLAVAVSLNLGVLVVFKYSNFFIDNFKVVFDAIGLRFGDGTLRLMMPLGLSFYTFMLISHLVDCWRGRFDGVRQKAAAFYAYVSFFPHLVAGPIDRSRMILPQLQADRKFSFDYAREGMWQILNGLVKKLVVADVCAEAVNFAWGDLDNQTSLSLWIVAFLYSMQIYCDFSGFSDMAIGLGKLFGLRLMDNFRYPYFARNVSEFWRHWHISLTSWFTEYVYIPLGGSRCGQIRTCINTLIIFVLCGFWHGANWSYGLWGLICGLTFIPYLLQKHPDKYKEVVKRVSFTEIAKIMITFVVITLTWIVFRDAEADFSVTLAYYKHLLMGGFGMTAIPYLRLSIVSSIALLAFEWFGRKRDFILANLIVVPRLGRWIIYLGLIELIWFVYLYLPVEPSADQFIYQNF